MFEASSVLVESLTPEPLWVLLVGFGIAFLLAFSVGANDVSNSFGTSVGSKVLTVTQACLLATIFEVAGATLLGYAVCDTFRVKMYNIELYKDTQKDLMFGALACLIGSAGWNIIATALKMPISGTHSIIGATIGFNLVLRGWNAIKWFDMLRIVISWFASPLLAGAISSLIYVIISKTVVRKVNPLKYGLKALPLFYGATIFINISSIVIGGPNVMGLDKIPWYGGLFIALVFAAATICIVALLYVPKLKHRITDEIITRTIGVKKERAIGSLNNRGRSRARGGHGRGVMETRMITRTGDNTEKSIAFDNAAFKSTEGVADTPGNPKRTPELTLSVADLETRATGALPENGPEKPQVAPKPVHLLKRQFATSEPSKSQSNDGLEEIDLNGSGEKKIVPKKVDIELAPSGIAPAGGSPGCGELNSPGMISGERLEVFRLFSALQILTACFSSFAHGSNDVSNAVAPFIPIWNICAYGREDVTRPTQIWILLLGGIGICLGLWAWGRAVMGTVGDGLTKLTPSKGFSIELGAAISVLTATKLGLPISTTHCKVGSVVIVGVVASKFCSQDNLLNMSNEERIKESDVREKAVDWKLFGNIAITWIVTVPLAATASGLVMLLLQRTVM